jgi:hypothetical protein
MNQRGSGAGFSQLQGDQFNPAEGGTPTIQGAPGQGKVQQQGDGAV